MIISGCGCWTWGKRWRREAYAETGGLTLRVWDEFCPWNDGTYLLEAGVDGAECTRVESRPRIELGVSDLGAAYLGGVTFSALARAGRVVERESGALATADRMFRAGARALVAGVVED